MSQFAPHSVVLSDYVVATIAVFRISIRALDGTTELAATNYPVDPSGTTTCPVGSDGTFTPVPDGTQVRIFVISGPTPGHGDNVEQEALDGSPWTVTELNAGVGSIVVNV